MDTKLVSDLPNVQDQHSTAARKAAPGCLDFPGIDPVRGMAAEARPQMPTGMLLAARNRSCGICRLTHLSEDHGDVATADH